MSTATLTSKGQINIPIHFRNDFKVNVGDRLEFVRIGQGRYEFVVATREVTALKGMFAPAKKKSASIQAINAVIARRGTAAR